MITTVVAVAAGGMREAEQERPEGIAATEE